MIRVTREAPAKLNLTLQVVGRRPDSYHLLDSLVAFTEYGDTVNVAASDDLSLEIDGPFGPMLMDAPGDNLVLRAARLLRDHAGTTAGAAIRLTKRLPVASGIGGGSSDAAATLLALSELWSLTLGAADLAALGLRLGADVPVCLSGRTARLQGIGEIVTPMPAVPPIPTVLVNPGIGLRTPDVFAARTGPYSDPRDWKVSRWPQDSATLVDALRWAGNDLAAPAIDLLPTISGILAALQAQAGCLLAAMSGSGATCFGLFADEPAAEAAAAAMSTEQPGWWVVPTRLRGGEAA